MCIRDSSLTFQTKFNNIAGSKPAGFIVYNNVPGDSLVVMSLATDGVPAAFISQADGEAMLAAADHHLSCLLYTSSEGVRRVRRVRGGV